VPAVTASLQGRKGHRRCAEGSAEMCSAKAGLRRLTPSAPKSVSLVWALGDEQTQASVLRAQHAAETRLMRWRGRHADSARCLEISTYLHAAAFTSEGAELASRWAWSRWMNWSCRIPPLPDQ